MEKPSSKESCEGEGRERKRKLEGPKFTKRGRRRAKMGTGAERKAMTEKAPKKEARCEM